MRYFQVLDQTIRIIQASIDVLAELGHLSSVLTMIQLMQCIKQARWPTDSPLAMLPNIDPALEAEGASIPSLEAADLPTLGPKDFAPIAKKHGVRNVDSLFRAAQALPNLDLKITTATASHIEATITRLNAPTNPNFKIRAPLFPKAQQEGMFAIVGNKEKDEIYALKRVGWRETTWTAGARGRGPNVKVRLELPPGLDGTDATMWVVSDGYVGMERKLGVTLQNTQTVPGVWVEKEDAKNRGFM